MIADERRRSLLGYLADRGASSIAELTDFLRVSHMTVRRDVQLLEGQGRLTSVAGGVSLPSRIAFDASHESKLGMHPGEKEAIAARAVQLVHAGNLIYLDAGTTMLALARQLVALPVEQRFDVVTNDLAVAAAFAARPSASVQLLGGNLDVANLATDGPTAAAALAAFNIDVAYVSTSSFDLRGLSVPSEAKALVKRAILDSAARTLLTTDSSKYGKVAAHRAVPLGAFDGIVTDEGLPDAAREHARQLRLELFLTSNTTDSKGTR